MFYTNATPSLTIIQFRDNPLFMMTKAEILRNFLPFDPLLHFLHESLVLSISHSVFMI